MYLNVKHLELAFFKWKVLFCESVLRFIFFATQKKMWHSVEGEHQEAERFLFYLQRKQVSLCAQSRTSTLPLVTEVGRYKEFLCFLGSCC